MGKADIGLIGLAVMGQNLVLNMNDHGFTVAVFNRTVSKVDEFLGKGAKGTRIIGAHSLAELVGLLKRPRRVMLLVQAGPAVDDFIGQLIPLLETGDMIIDGGNSNYNDSIRRTAYVESKGLLYIGTGVSGGEEGARLGPSIMPGGSPAAWQHVKPIFQAIAAKVDGAPCCDWVGENGAGHYVKMVHNGIEYGDMQLICEAYQLMRDGLGMKAPQMHEVFAEWNRGKLDSYLIEITRDILAYEDEDGKPLVDKILDTAEQKGTGKWTGISAFDMGIPLTMIVEAVLGRALSALKDERVAASRVLVGTQSQDRRRPESVHPGSGRGGLCLQTDLLHPGLYADARRRERVQVESQLWRHCAHVAGRLHHPFGFPRPDQGGVRPESAAHQSFAGSVFCGADRIGAGGVAARRRESRSERHPGAGDVQRARVFRRLSPRVAARESAPGAARLFRRAHLPARGQTARRVLPHELDRSRRQRDIDGVEEGVIPDKRRTK